VAEYYHGPLGKVVSTKPDSILMYHSVGNESEYGNVSTDRLRRDLAFLTEQFEVATLKDLTCDERAGRVALTFDDGFLNFYTDALPIIEEYGVPATVFVVTNAIDNQETELNADETMSHSELAELVDHDLVTIGNHTRTHPVLTEVDEEATLREEIIDAKEELRDRLGIAAEMFCYPGGHHNQRVTDIVRESHELAVATENNSTFSDRYRLPRIVAHLSEVHVRWELSPFGGLFP